MEKPPRTSKHKLSELRPCIECNGPVNPAFAYIKVKTAIVNQRAVREQLGLAQMLGSLRLAEVMGAHGDEGFEVIEEDDAVTRIMVCHQCLAMHGGNLPIWIERIANLKREHEEAKA